MAALVTLAQAKGHLRITTDDQDDDIALKVDHASAIVLNHLKSQAVAGWSDGTVAVPGNVQAATLILLTSLREHLGDDMTPSGVAWEAVARLLVGFRDPALA